MINFLNSAAFHMFGAPTSYAELFGFITGALCVYYVVKNNVWNFPIGVLNAGFFLLLFWNAHLFADSLLQVMFIVLNLMGWVAWLRFGPNQTSRPITLSSWKTNLGVVAFIGVFTALFSQYLAHHGDSYPFLDALTTGMSIGAQYLLNLKYLQNWYIWIIADLIYIPLYAAKDLYLTSIVYVLFLSLCIAGIVQWRQIMNEKPSIDVPYINDDGWIVTNLGPVNTSPLVDSESIDPFDYEWPASPALTARVAEIKEDVLRRGER